MVIETVYYLTRRVSQGQSGFRLSFFSLFAIFFIGLRPVTFIEKSALVQSPKFLVFLSQLIVILQITTRDLNMKK